MKKTFRLWATIRSAHDGDTLYGDVDQGMGTWNKGLSKSGVGLRLYGVNARELKTPGGIEARDNLARLIPVGTELQIDCLDWDAWNGRIDVLFLVPGIPDLNALLLAQQWVAGPYFGTGPKPVPPWPRTV